MDLQEIERIVGEAVRDADLQPWEIPGIDLYMDQITNLLADKRREGAEHYRDRELTKTMINNYSKDGLISPVKGKKYTKEQILQMLTVYELKNTLSIGEIKTLLQGLYGQPDYDAKMLEEIYGRYLEIKELQRRSAWEFLQTCIEKSELDPTRQTDFFLLLLGMSSASAYLKSGVQLLLEGIAPSGTDEESAEEPRDKAEEKAAEKSRRKAEKKAKKEEKAAAKSGEKSHAEATAEDREETAHETE
jgi:hypothetical protein